MLQRLSLGWVRRPALRGGKVQRCYLLPWTWTPFPHLFPLVQADVRDEEALYRAFKGVDCVFHMASYGMSGAEKVGFSHITPRVRQSRVPVLALPSGPCIPYHASPAVGRTWATPTLHPASMRPNTSSAIWVCFLFLFF